MARRAGRARLPVRGGRRPRGLRAAVLSNAAPPGTGTLFAVARRVGGDGNVRARPATTMGGVNMLIGIILVFVLAFGIGASYAGAGLRRVPAGKVGIVVKRFGRRHPEDDPR